MTISPLRIPTLSLALVVATCMGLESTAHAVLLAYDPFRTGSNPASGEYYAGSDSKEFPAPNGSVPSAPTDALVWASSTSSAATRVGQDPTVIGFTGAWRTSATLGSQVYAEVQAAATQAYTAAGGSQMLQTTGGQVSLFRASGSTTTGDKNSIRDLSGITGATYGNSLYVSGLVTFQTALTASSIELNTTNASASTNLTMSFAANGAISIAGGAQTASSAASTVAANQTYFFVWKLEDNATTGSGDRFTLYLNPTSLSAENLNTATLTVGAAGSTFFGNGAADTINQLTWTGNILGGNAMIFDEFRIGTTWADVAPFSLVPEPSRAILAALAFGAILLQRRRRAN